MDLSDSWSPRPVVNARVRAAEAVFEDLRGAIARGDLPLGVRLPSETALAQGYGVSRPVIREALRSAQALGLTRTRTGSGTYVTAPPPSSELSLGGYSVRDLMEARPYFEVPAAAWAAARRSDEQSAEITELCAAMDAEADSAAWADLDSRFHRAIAEASGNAVFAQVVTQTRAALTAQSELVNTVSHRRDASGREHRRIAEAIAAGSGPAAEKAMRAHLDAVEEAVLGLLDHRDG